MRSTGDPGRPDAVQLGVYLDLVEVVALLRHQVEHQLREEGGLAYVQFQLLARLGDAPESGLRMTDLADGVVHSRSGLTYQARQLEEAGLVSRSGDPEDDRGVLLAITTAGRDLLARVLPGHVQVVDRLLYGAMDRTDLEALGRLLAPLRDHMRAAPPRSATPRARKRR